MGQVLIRKWETGLENLLRLHRVCYYHIPKRPSAAGEVEGIGGSKTRRTSHHDKGRSGETTRTKSLLIESQDLGVSQG
jgi:hypothetical protein